jgi:hypothetical protein
MPDERKTVYVNDHPVKIFIWAEVQHCVNAYNSELFLKIQRGDAEIVDINGDRIGWGGYAGDGQHIYVRMIEKVAPEPVEPENPQWVEQLIEGFKNEPAGDPPHSIWRYKYKGQIVFFVPRQHHEVYSALYDVDGNELCAPDGGFGNTGDGRCPDFFVAATEEKLIWKDTRKE